MSVRVVLVQVMVGVCASVNGRRRRAAGRCAGSGRYRRARRACAEPLTCCREVVEVERYSLKLRWTPDRYYLLVNKSKVFDPPSQRRFQVLPVNH